MTADLVGAESKSKGMVHARLTSSPGHIAAERTTVINSDVTPGTTTPTSTTPIEDRSDSSDSSTNSTSESSSTNLTTPTRSATIDPAKGSNPSSISASIHASSPRPPPASSAITSRRLSLPSNPDLGPALSLSDILNHRSSSSSSSAFTMSPSASSSSIASSSSSSSSPSASALRISTTSIPKGAPVTPIALPHVPTSSLSASLPTLHFQAPRSLDPAMNASTPGLDAVNTPSDPALGVALTTLQLRCQFLACQNRLLLTELDNARRNCHALRVVLTHSESQREMIPMPTSPPPITSSTSRSFSSPTSSELSTSAQSDVPLSLGNAAPSSVSPRPCSTPPSSSLPTIHSSTKEGPNQVKSFSSRMLPLVHIPSRNPPPPIERTLERLYTPGKKGTPESSALPSATSPSQTADSCVTTSTPSSKRGSTLRRKLARITKSLKTVFHPRRSPASNTKSVSVASSTFCCAVGSMSLKSEQDDERARDTSSLVPA
ncbi:hypothetical protein BJ684DRAFT_20798 [Piptocephalis cylindrospora]|uniref:Uncharacterized protein n=1 Tax=Piptocephalis cylindrospora TaxID=1907219 RepID=A0A4V1IXY5_9FUNG|nr:hypothetical protein BJ684DRAFT_20798 [Piptocephalis cylindrospora]|eukprot:RKP12679.1 hypothetical protein BJ684DRAFT_20798 [Piptocephalis cylindrospora]